MEYTIKKLATLAGVTTRTLRHYDELGLLKPLRLNSSGYRIYGTAEVDALQQILFYRALGVGLAEIRKILQSPSFDRLAALKSHRGALAEKRAHLNLLISNLNKTILSEEGNFIMTDQEKFEGMKQRLVAENDERYGEEVRRRYGETAAKESNAKMLKLSPEEYERMQQAAADIQAGLEQAVRAGEAPSGEAGQRLAALHRDWLGYSWPGYSPDAHAGLVQTYVDDERFTAYYDKSVPGCAAFLRDAVLCYLGKR